MKAIYIIFLIISLSQQAFSQTYIQGRDVVPFEQVATSTYLRATDRVSYEEAKEKVSKMSSDKPDVEISKIGEFYIYDNLLISINCKPMSVKKQLKYTGLYRYYQGAKNPGSVDNHVEYKDSDHIQFFIFYNKKYNILYFFIDDQDFSIAGSVRCSNDQRVDAQKFIQKLVYSIKFK